MILEPSSRKTIGKVRSYEDPLFRSKRGKLELAKLLYRANTLRVVSRLRGPAVKCFTVLGNKVNSDGSMSLRLVFDLRGTKSPFQCTNNHYVLKGNDDKLFPIIAFTIFTLQHFSVSPQHLFSSSRCHQSPSACSNGHDQPRVSSDRKSGSR